MILGLLDEAVTVGARLAPACEVIGLDPRTVQRWKGQGVGADGRAGPATRPRNALSAKERARVVELMDNPDNMVKWQENLVSYKQKSGTPGEVGARTVFVYGMPGREQEMIETIVSKNFPDEFTATYEAPGVWNLNRNFFEELGPNKTRWRLEAEFRFRGSMRIFLLLNKKAFPRESLRNMNNFKKFAESSDRLIGRKKDLIE